MNANDLFNLLSKLGIQRLVQRGSNIMGCCPIHGERRPSWGINVNPPHLFGCFACSARGSLAWLLRDHYHYSDAHVKLLLGDESLQFRSAQSGSLQVGALSLGGKPQIEVVDSSDWKMLMMEPAGLLYMLRRRFTPRTVVRTQLKFNRQDRRVLFPWFFGKNFYGATGRTIDANEPSKIVGYYAVKKREMLYIPSGRISANKPLILVEGELDALRVWQAGFRNVAALGRGTLSDAQKILTLKTGVPELVLAFDNDQAGQRLTRETLDAFDGTGVKLAVVDYPAIIKDPEELRDAQVPAFIAGAKVFRKIFKLALK